MIVTYNSGSLLIETNLWRMMEDGIDTTKHITINSSMRNGERRRRVKESRAIYPRVVWYKV
jgi:hypothetical protein